MKQKPCDEWVEQLTKPERDLPFSERAGLEKHLESCPDCTAIHREQRVLSERIRTLPAPDFPAGLSQRMREAMQASPHTPGENPSLMGSEGLLDNDLLQAMAFDVASTFPRLVNAYHPHLYKFVLSQVKSPEIAETIMHDCWVRIYQALDQYSSEKIRALKLRVWLFRIVENRISTSSGKENIVDAFSIE